MTSQIFANIYLNEFDRYVRHRLKPLAYIRYGDDFLILSPSRHDAENIRASATSWLRLELSLDVHVSNDVIFPVNRGALFLGHQIYATSAAVDKALVRKIHNNINASNIASYSAMRLPRNERKNLPWLL